MSTRFDPSTLPLDPIAKGLTGRKRIEFACALVVDEALGLVAVLAHALAHGGGA